MDAKGMVASVRARMQGFLQFGLFEDPELMSRELRGLRTQITRTIVELEKLPKSQAAAEPEPDGPGAAADLEALDGELTGAREPEVKP